MQINHLMNSGALHEIETLKQYFWSKLHEASDCEAFTATGPAVPLEQIIAHRNKTYLEHGLQYLIRSNTRAGTLIEHIDSRSAHVWVTSRGEIAGSMRMTPFPFEIESVLPAGHHMTSPYLDHVEFGRLVTSSRNSCIFEKLMALACHSAIIQEYKGIVAMCRSVQRRLFERYGLTPLTIDPITIENRANGAYWVMQATWSDLYSALEKRKSVTPATA
ncbi:hypothetical protein N8I74_17990 [Chitiniphilus purpureus]|uniref:Acyl-homoserine-lactone synthase n=1 Tax=Chitiniphilus purpureus TaxID=2981137 RepID=A0ABY6DLE5_9NEIS|nr:hypothetical protein [Chitiniphilus sp. CD1]UXY15180.1 hypothetical protein N8I74_17990 [Chitiniphilus sp. CD1]